ncbi:phosphatidate cytidylyltransferase [Coprobacter fastidiosus]|uniref:phosphatidate cytidylyltransferase n=1 Tax=Coprobacter fastidiosus TaxID=1099853 RepID=UPI00242018B9|nr:phosphatidate cytidylyltransferase [Coprobacter fastidiosus]
MKNLIIRAITGILFIGIIIGAILYSKYTLLALLLVITTLTLTEFYRLIEGSNLPKLTLFVNILGGNYLTLSLYLYASDILPAFSKGVVFIPYLIYFLCCFIIQLYMKDKDPITRWSHSFMGQVYIALPIGLLSFLAFEPSSTFLFYNPWLLLSFFAFIWINDTGAFLVGSAIGKKRLFERISPKKSWEGFWGGIAFNLVLAYILSTQFNVLSQLEWYGLAITVSIFATLGDLCESLLKRTLQIKDSGSILPGHGGMLDRFDSVLLAAPAAVIYLFLCHQFY